MIQRILVDFYPVKSETAQAERPADHAKRIGMPDAVTHSFRKTVATLIDDDGLSARIGADHLGHSRISMTPDKYMARGRVHTSVADMLDRTINRVRRAPGRIRTCDTGFRRAVLYPLSYEGGRAELTGKRPGLWS